MWLSDFEEAIAAMKEHCNYSCFDRIETNIFGGSFLFCPCNTSNFYFIYHRKNGKIVKRYSDTWRNPDHYEVIYEGDK